MKFAVKELERNSKKCEKEEKAEKLKTKKAIQKGNMEVNNLYFIYLSIWYIFKSYNIVNTFYKYKLYIELGILEAWYGIYFK